MTPKAFRELLQPVTQVIAGRPVDQALASALNQAFPTDGETFEAIAQACRQAIAAGWMCVEGGPGRRFGRIIETGAETGGLSVDVVDLENIAGPHHCHPTGEICMIMPQTPAAKFDGQGAGWKVYEPGSAHRPTVTEGEALVLYMLPAGRIEFTE
ncbi:MAG: DUF4863 family protein [Alphaproteobacteria bacterium]|jgi:hypothetical protein|nr:DUF4863 family protein [Alphaproteobacteria bacterium]